jgi:hypothetical protein
MPRYNNLSSDELELIRRFIEESDIDAIDNEMRELVEHWPWLLAKLPPPNQTVRAPAESDALPRHQRN